VSDHETKKSLTFKYIFPDDHNPVFANGAFGGVSPSGDIMVHFYTERAALPRKVSHELNPDGTLGEAIDTEPEDHAESLVRFITCGVVLTLEGAKSVHDWLGKKIESAEKLRDMKKATAELKEKGELDG
jgi:hypothetical protein